MTITDAEGQPSAPFTFSLTCVPKPSLPRQLFIGATFGAASTLGNVLTFGGTGKARVGNALKILGASGATSIAIFIAITQDPPDPDFTIIAEPTVPSIPSVAAAEEVTPELADAFNALIDNYARVAALELAFLKSIERAQGAGAAGDVGWYSRQMDAAGRRLAPWADLLDAQPDLLARLASAAQAAGLSDLLSLSADDVVTFQEDIIVDGLPSFITDVLDQLGADGAAWQILEDLILNADPADFAGSYLDKLTDPAYASALHAAAGELRQLFPPIPVDRPSSCSPGSCDDGDACTDDSCDAASGCVHAVRPGLDGVICVLDVALPSGVCQQVPKGVTKLIGKARSQVRKAIAKPKKSKALLGKANKTLVKAVRVGTKALRKHKISEECLGALALQIEDVRTRMAALLAS